MYSINDRSIQDVLQSLGKIVVDTSELARWASSIETTAKGMNDDKNDNITFEYFCDEKAFKFFVKDAKSRDNLLKSIQLHLPLIPESAQGFFSVFKYNLKNVKFD